MNPLTALLDVEMMSETDRRTIASGIPASTLMENAGRRVAEEIQKRWARCPVVVLCGPGSNGGDGFVAARRLAEADWPVRVALLVPREKLRGEAAYHAGLWSGPIEALTVAALDGAQLVIDAIFGAGLSRPLDVSTATILATATLRSLIVVAVDVPSGVMGETGADMGAAPATLTVTYFRKKIGHVLQPGRSLCGEVVVTDIGTPKSVFEFIAPNTFENDPLLWLHALPRAQIEANKYTRGHALVLGGYPTTGAARMAARAAARSGAGLTTIAVPEIAVPIYATSLLSIMITPLGTPDDFAHAIAERSDTAFLIGPGAGVGDETRSHVLKMLNTRRPTVLDADALSSFRDQPHLLFGAIAGHCVMTPHEGEFARLFDISGDKLHRARLAARLSNAVLILKGSDTVIAAPDGRAIINANAPPSLATAGAGDVLSGIVLGLLAQGMEPFLAAAAAVWLHGAAASTFGPGLLAEDLPDLLPVVFQNLLLPVPHR
jgi:NAD(P)H-hydrate epimerase